MTGEIRHVICDTWHMAHDTWHVTHDIWHMMCDLWRFFIVLSVSLRFGIGATFYTCPEIQNLPNDLWLIMKLLNIDTCKLSSFLRPETSEWIFCKVFLTNRQLAWKLLKLFARSHLAGTSTQLDVNMVVGRQHFKYLTTYSGDWKVRQTSIS